MGGGEGVCSRNLRHEFKSCTKEGWEKRVQQVEGIILVSAGPPHCGCRWLCTAACEMLTVRSVCGQPQGPGFFILQ